jgi:hypothetical protein
MIAQERSPVENFLPRGPIARGSVAEDRDGFASYQSRVASVANCEIGYKGNSLA